MDPKLLANYEAQPRPATFLRDAPVPKTPRPLWPLLVYAALLGFAATGCIATLLNHIT